MSHSLLWLFSPQLAFVIPFLNQAVPDPAPDGAPNNKDNKGNKGKAEDSEAEEQRDLEAAMLDLMYELPSRDDVEECIINEDVIDQGSEPLLVVKREAESA